MRSIISVLALLLFQSTANADSDVKPQLKAQNEAVVARTTEAQGVFMVLEDGNIKHIQSGAICIGELPNVTFWQAQIYSTAGSKGTDVGCDYARTSSDGAAVSKLTIFLVKNEGNLSLDEVFEKYRTEIKTAHPEAIAKHAALQINNTDAKSKPDYRAEGYTISINGQPIHSELIVGLKSGWIIEIRATYPHDVIVVTKETSKTEMQNQLADIESPYIAFLTANDSLGNTP